MPRDTDLSHIAVRDAYLARFPGTCFGLGEWRRYTAGYWPPIHEQVVKREIQAVAENEASDGLALQLTSSFVSSVYSLLKARTYIADERFDANPNVIAFDDCVIDSRTRERFHHSPDNYFTSKLPFAYDPAASSEAWDKFLADTVPDCIDFLQEFAGYCLTNHTRYETALWLYGPPGGGKSTFIEGLTAMLGAKSCVLGLSEITTSHFGLTNLPGKTLAISTEQPAEFSNAANIINTLVSGERIPVNRKFKDPIDLIPQVKLVWAMNELPRITMAGEGLFRRVKVVYFPGVPVEQRNPRVKEAIKESGMAIANWALDGLARLEARGRFLIPAIVEEATDRYKLYNDVTQLFIDDCCVAEEPSREQASLLYKAYTKWCKETGHRPVTSTRFGLELDRLGYKSHKISVIYRLGIRLKVEGEDEANQILGDYLSE